MGISKITYITMILSVLLLLGCKKEDKNNHSDYTKGLIVWSGDLAVDGCEWQILIDNQYYKASNLPKNYEVDSLNVRLIFEPDTVFKYYCGDFPEPKKAIKIFKIEKQ